MSFNIKIRTTDKHYFDARDSIGIHVLYKYFLFEVGSIGSTTYQEKYTSESLTNR